MKPFYILACGLLLVAVVVEIAGKHYDSTVALFSARSVMLTSAERIDLHRNVENKLRLAAMAHIAAMVLAAVGALMWLMSLFRHEQASPLLPAVLLLVFLILQCLLV